MAHSFQILNGDLCRDTIGRFKEVSGRDLLSQHIYKIILETIKPGILSSESVGDIVDVAEKFISLQLLLSFQNLKSVLDYGLTLRQPSEIISDLDIILVKRSRRDPRIIKFWVRVFSGVKELVEQIGQI